MAHSHGMLHILYSECEEEEEEKDGRDLRREYHHQQQRGYGNGGFYVIF